MWHLKVSISRSLFPSAVRGSKSKPTASSAACEKRSCPLSQARLHETLSKACRKMPGYFSRRQSSAKCFLSMLAPPAEPIPLLSPPSALAQRPAVMGDSNIPGRQVLRRWGQEEIQKQNDQEEKRYRDGLCQSPLLCVACFPAEARSQCLLARSGWLPACGLRICHQEKAF